MDMDWNVTIPALAAAQLVEAGRNVRRAAGAANGAGVDRMRDNVEQAWSQRDWGDTSEVRARRSSDGRRLADAYLFVEGGAAWREDHPTHPDPTVRPSVDSELGWIEEEIGRRVQGLL